jgi:hypothetical protein
VRNSVTPRDAAAFGRRLLLRQLLVISCATIAFAFTGSASALTRGADRSDATISFGVRCLNQPGGGCTYGKGAGVPQGTTMHFKARLLHYQPGTVARLNTELALIIVGFYHRHAHILATCHALTCETDFAPPDNELGTWDFSASVVAVRGGSSALSSSVIVVWIANPDQLTLTVNGTTYSMTLKALAAGKPPVDPVHLTLKSMTPIHATALIHDDLPPGWSIVVDHPGDPRSPGGGTWYQVCAEKLNRVCEGDSQGMDASGGDILNKDFILARLASPTNLILSVQINIDWTKY